MTLTEAARAVGPGGAQPAQAILAVVDEARCTGCGSCAAVCPTAAVAVERVARVDDAACIACGQCIVACPLGAIDLEPVRRAGAQRR
jgi:ferredoxin